MPFALFVLLAGWNEASACSQAPIQLRGVMPPDGAVDVPQEAVVRVVFTMGEGSATYEWTGPDGLAVPFDEVVTPTGIENPDVDADYAELAARAPLAPGAHHVKVLLDGVEAGESSFSVSTDVDLSQPEAPSGSGLSIVETLEPADECGFYDARTATMTITPDEDTNSVVHVIRQSTGQVVASFASWELGEVMFVMDAVTGSEECLTLVQENALGDESEPSAPICATVEGAPGPDEEGDESGCQTAPGSFGAGALVLLAALVTRRKRA